MKYRIGDKFTYKVDEDDFYLEIKDCNHISLYRCYRFNSNGDYLNPEYFKEEELDGHTHIRKFPWDIPKVVTGSSARFFVNGQEVKLYEEPCNHEWIESISPFGTKWKDCKKCQMKWEDYVKDINTACTPIGTDTKVYTKNGKLHYLDLDGKEIELLTKETK